MGGTTEGRAARDIVATMGDKVLFAYIPEMAFLSFYFLFLFSLFLSFY